MRALLFSLFPMVRQTKFVETQLLIAMNHKYNFGITIYLPYKPKSTSHTEQNTGPGDLRFEQIVKKSVADKVPLYFQSSTHTFH